MNPYHDARLYAEQNADFTEDSALYTELAREYGHQVLELGSGTGRVSLALAREGMETHGIDLGQGMVDFANQAAHEQGLSARFSCGDVRTFDLEKTFDLILFPYNSICHMLNPMDLDQALNRVRRHLKPHGVFAPSIFVPQSKLLGRDPTSLVEVAHFWSPSRGEDMEVLEQCDYDPLEQIQKLTWFYQGDGEDSDVFSVEYTLRVYYPQELKRCLEDHGFIVEAILGDYSRAPATKSSLALTYLCRVAGGQK